MKKILTLVLALALFITALSGCGSKPAADKTPEELAELYSSAIMENGGEMAEYNPAFTQAKEDDGSAMVLENMGLNTEDMAAFGISASLMNIKAYAIAAIMRKIEGWDKAERTTYPIYGRQRGYKRNLS